MRRIGRVLLVRQAPQVTKQSVTRSNGKVERPTANRASQLSSEYSHNYRHRRNTSQRSKLTLQRRYYHNNNNNNNNDNDDVISNFTFTGNLSPHIKDLNLRRSPNDDNPRYIADHNANQATHQRRKHVIFGRPQMSYEFIPIFKYDNSNWEILYAGSTGPELNAYECCPLQSTPADPSQSSPSSPSLSPSTPSTQDMRFPIGALQSMPNYSILHDPSFNEDPTTLLHELFNQMLPSLVAAKAFRVHFLEGDQRLYRKVKDFKTQFMEMLKFRAPSVYQKSQQFSVKTNEPESYLLQILVKNQRTIWVSWTKLSWDSLGWRYPLPWPMGYIPVEENPGAPSTAYKKLEAILAMWKNLNIRGKTVVEFGGFPGGMTTALLRKGAIVETVDVQAITDPVLTRHPDLTIHAKNAKFWLPEDKEDLLVGDLSIKPVPSLQTLLKWLKLRVCRKFIWTIKFVGQVQYIEVIALFEYELKKIPHCNFRFIKTTYHKNEVVVIGELFELDEDFVPLT